MHITLCDFIVPWDSLSATQKKSLNQRYQMGCECKVNLNTTILDSGPSAILQKAEFLGNILDTYLRYEGFVHENV